ncbi:hypothetical protein GVAV_002298 [Gurleya vavrai]
MIFSFFSIVNSLVLVNHFENTKTYNTNNCSIQVRQYLAYVGDEPLDFDVLMNVKPVMDGFNLTFRCRKKALVFNVYSNYIEITYKRSNLDTQEFADFMIEMHGGMLEDVSLDEVVGYGDLITIVRLRFLGNDENRIFTC